VINASFIRQARGRGWRTDPPRQSNRRSDGDSVAKREGESVVARPIVEVFGRTQSCGCTYTSTVNYHLPRHHKEFVTISKLKRCEDHQERWDRIVERCKSKKKRGK
jgi:hypothetical protein